MTNPDRYQPPKKNLPDMFRDGIAWTVLLTIGMFLILPWAIPALISLLRALGAK